MIWIGGFGWGPGLAGLIITIVMFAINAAGLYLVIRRLRRHPEDLGGAGWTERNPWGDGTEQDPESGSRGLHGLPPGHRGGSEALRILEERYARGEIDREEFLRRRADLLGEE